MRIGYIREAAGLPDRRAQEATLREAGIKRLEEGVSVWTDLGPAIRKGVEFAELPAGLTSALCALSAGDELVVAGPEILGGSRGQILEVIQAIGARQSAVFDASIGRVIPWSTEALAVLDFAARGETRLRSFALMKARMRRAELGRTGGPKVRLSKDENPDVYAAAVKIWLDTSLTSSEAAAKIGVSVSTCYRTLPARGTPVFGGWGDT